MKSLYQDLTRRPFYIVTPDGGRRAAAIPAPFNDDRPIEVFFDLFAHFVKITQAGDARPIPTPAQSIQTPAAPAAA